MCTSEARSRTAWVRILSTTCTTGAFSATWAGASVFEELLRRVVSTASKAWTYWSRLPMA